MHNNASNKQLKKLNLQLATISFFARFDRQKNSVPLSMEVEEELEPGTRLGEVTAIDEDIGENAAINYAIICEYNTVLSLILNP